MLEACPYLVLADEAPDHLRPFGHVSRLSLDGVGLLNQVPGPGLGRPQLSLHLHASVVHLLGLPPNVVKGCSGQHQVTNSITILLAFDNQGSTCKSIFNTIAQSRFAEVGLDGVLGPPRRAQYT